MSVTLSLSFDALGFLCKYSSTMPGATTATYIYFIIISEKIEVKKEKIMQKIKQSDKADKGSCLSICT